MSTDRVEINPDNTNKPLEQSQEDNQQKVLKKIQHLKKFNS